MAKQPEYETFEIPENKEPPEYTWAERRAELYRMIQRAGHPRNLAQSYSRLGDRYDVSKGQISQDIDRLREYEHGRVGDGEKANTSFLAQRAIDDALDSNDYKEAFELQLSYYEWLFKTGEKDKEPDKHEVDGSGIVINYGDE